MGLDKRTFLLVTGASRGLGREVAVQLAARLKAGSVVVLTARSRADLFGTQQMIAERAPHARVCVHAEDLSQTNDAGLEDIVTSGLKYLCEGEEMEAAMVVHNAGTVGDTSRSVLQHDSVASVDSYFRLNVSVCWALNSAFVRLVRPRLVAGDGDITVINISSLCAIQPFKSMSVYCSGKAARDMAFRVLALEQPSLRVLSYAPGPLKTAMSQTVAACSTDPDVRKVFVDGLNGDFLSCDVTVSRMVTLLEADKFKSGAHIDYFDKEDEAGGKAIDY